MGMVDLAQIAQTGVYVDGAGTQHFVPLAGKVYSVRKAGEHWRLSTGELHGPYVQRDAQDAWALDVGVYHPRYGQSLQGMAGRYKTRGREREIINVEARGIRQIAALSSWKAQCVNEGLNVATYYAATMLFKTWDEFKQKWEDFGSDSSTSPLKDKVLQTTGSRTIDAARSIFMSDADKRIDTILANADSVTYLISQLGRELDAGA
jgi:hypothetical protein